VFGKLLAQSGSLNQPFQSSTKRYDVGAGLNYYGYRFYAPAIGRWMNRDPLGEAGGINLYGFVSNNPVNWVDPWGLWSIWGGGTVIGAGGAGGNVGAGIAYDSDNGGFGFYGSGGPAYGLAGSGGGEIGFFSGDLECTEDVYSAGFAGFSVGLVLGSGGWGIVGGFAPVGLPVEFSKSEPHTVFTPATPIIHQPN
jgi:RHS repeat-associated protein